MAIILHYRIHRQIQIQTETDSLPVCLRTAMWEESDREGASISQVSLTFSLQQHIQADRKTNKQADSLRLL